MRFILSSIGTLGDVLPFLKVAGALRHRGHQVVLLANGHFQPLVEKRGIEFFAVGGRREHARLLEDPQLYHPFDGVKRICDDWILPSIAKTLEYVAALRGQADTVLIGSVATVGLRMAGELHGIPIHSLVLSPFMLPSVHLMPASPAISIPAWIPAPIKTIFQALGDRFLDGVLKEKLNLARREQGLAPIGGTVRSWWLSPDSVIGLFPDWFAPPQVDWPRAVRLTGFLCASDDDLAPEVREFIGCGPPLIVVTMGSLLGGNFEICQAVAQSCLDRGFRGLFLISEAKLPHSKLILQSRFAPLAPVFEQASLIVHHAGIGTAAEALKAGIPQLLAPYGHDQFDNAARLVRLGVARRIRPKGEGLLPQMEAMIANKQVVSSCERARRLMNSLVWTDEICALLERPLVSAGASRSCGIS